MLEFHSGGMRIGQVYALHLDGDSSPQGHRYHLSEDVRAARSLDIYTETAARHVMPGTECALVEEDKRLRLMVGAAFDLRDHALVKATPLR